MRFKQLAVVCSAAALAASTLSTGLMTTASAGTSKSAQSPVYLVEGIRDLSNTYYTNWIKGGKAFLKSLGWDSKYLITMQNQGSSETQLANIKAIVARTHGNVVFNLDPNNAADDPAIAQYLDSHHIYFVTWWNKPNNIQPWQYPYWAMHITFDDYHSGYKMGMQLMQHMKTPYHGDVIAIQGMLGDTPEIERFAGFKDAIKKYPNVHLVSAQPGDWDQTKAYSIASSELVSHPNLAGIWCANDSMALGVIQALKAAGKSDVPVTGTDGAPQMFQAIEKSQATATVLSNSFFQGGEGLAIALAAKEGKLNLNSLPHSKRSWLASAPEITPQNVSKYYQEFYVNEPNYDWKNYFNFYQGAIK